MKQIILILFFYMSVYAHDPYWVQVIAVKKPASITAGFMHKVNKYSKHHIIVHQAGYNKVLLGSFDRYQHAKSATNYFQKVIAKDAFIVMHSPMIHTKQAPQKVVTAHVQTKKIDLTNDKTVAQVNITQAKAQTIAPQELNTTKKAPLNCASLCNSKQRREDEIASAIEFYRHSNLYKFSGAKQSRF
jgi:hypothetical protein